MSRQVKLRKNSVRAYAFRLALNSDIDRCSEHVSNGPIRDSCIAAITALFDHRIGATNQRQWHCEPKRPRSPEVKDPFPFRRLLYCKVFGLFTLENAERVDGCLTCSILRISGVAYETAGLRGPTDRIDCRAL